MRGILLGGLVEHTGLRFCFSCTLGSGSKHAKIKCTQIIELTAMKSLAKSGDNTWTYAKRSSMQLQVHETN